MANNIVTVSGMFGTGHTYFADSPVVIDISGLQWPGTSPFNIVRVEVVYKKPVGDNQYELVMVGDFHSDTGGQSVISFNISSALKTIWSDYEYTSEVSAAQSSVAANAGQSATRSMREYILRIYTEYLTSEMGGTERVFTQTRCSVMIDDVEYEDIPGGQCLIGGMTEWERSIIENDEDADVSHLEHTGVRNGDASTKPISSPERVGRDSITSWVDVKEGYTKSIFYPADATPEDDDLPGRQQGWTGHAPLVLRDSVAYIDFLFVNRRGAIETCSAQMLENMGIEVETKQYSRVGRPAFRPTRSLMAIVSGGRRSWSMSSGHQTREWVEWWTMEFLMARQWWMLYTYQDGTETRKKFVPVTVTPAKKNTTIYDHTKQQMESVEFTVTMALEG